VTLHPTSIAQNHPLMIILQGNVFQDIDNQF